MTASPKKLPVRMVLSYAHVDKPRLKRTGLIAFLQGLANAKKWEFWWDENMDYPRFNEEIKRRFDNANVIISVVSQNFLNSEYIRKVESKAARMRGKREDILVLPVLLTPSRWEEDEKWLKELHHFPTRGYLSGSGDKGLETNIEITEYISRYFNRRVLPFSDPKLIYKLRRLPETSLSPDQIRILTTNSCEKATEKVPNQILRAKICREAKRLGAGNSKNLGKKDLEAIDKKFLARRRKPDAEIVRWVLRCAGLHPQGRTSA